MHIVNVRNGDKRKSVLEALPQLNFPGFIPFGYNSIFICGLHEKNKESYVVHLITSDCSRKADMLCNKCENGLLLLSRTIYSFGGFNGHSIANCEQYDI